METVKATVEVIDEKHVIKIAPGEPDKEVIRIPMSKDDPKEVKAAFNKLILRIKNSSLQIELENRGDDLFSQVANEYVTQLNREMKEIYREMKKHGLTEG